ncbi:uncharacterized protein BP5553_03639 [Venustampulla echinocandica]|uniref:BTB domain-containing protein n=1 Tax=Venustampulla echinocandica TaxID=2656787 RepID=A0A370TUW2_9HELO|nr:uncharacterized protein BP5553_03639 [Venustampulla echinocandica]RDL39299.1 hypothetical protein BP5553_03639 [Venustampulla echinocandica]
MAPRKVSKRSNREVDEDYSEQPLEKRQFTGRSTCHSRRKSTKAKQTRSMTPAIYNTQESQPPPPIHSPSLSRHIEVIDLSQEFMSKTMTDHGSAQFRSGDVYIELQGPQKYSYTLLSRVLSRTSDWFKASLEQPTPEFNHQLAAAMTRTSGIAHRYDLSYDPDEGLWLLAKTSLTTPKELDKTEQSSNRSTRPELSLTLDGNSSPRTPPKQHRGTGDGILKYPTPSSNRKNIERGLDFNVEDPLDMKRYASEDPSIKEEEEAVETAGNYLSPKIDSSEDYPSIKVETAEDYLNMSYEQRQDTLSIINEEATDSPGISQSTKAECAEHDQNMENQGEVQIVENPLQMRCRESEITGNAKEKEELGSLPSPHSMQIEGQEDNPYARGAKEVEMIDTTPTTPPTKNRKTEGVPNTKRENLAASTTNGGNEGNIFKNEQAREDGVLDTANTDVINPHITYDEARVAFNNLFLAYYGRPPNICSTNTEVALQETELLLNISEFYGSTPILHASLNSALLQHGRSLYRAIRRDPPRWLFISYLLRCVPIFREAVIHIVGSHPHWPWTTVPKYKIPGPLLDLIDAKVEELQKLKVHVNGLLFLSSICVEGQDVMFARDSKGTSQSAYQVVHIWHDWFRSSLKHARSVGNEEHRTMDAVMYRKMARGGGAYLPSADINDMLKAQIKHPMEVGDGSEVKEDLGIMKQYAMKVIQPLVENESMLEPEREGIDYLTCTRVDGTELPWAIRQSH